MCDDVAENRISTGSAGRYEMRKKSFVSKGKGCPVSEKVLHEIQEKGGLGPV